MFKDSMRGQVEMEKKLKAQHSKEVNDARSQAVRTITNMITMHSLLESGQTI